MAELRSRTPADVQREIERVRDSLVRDVTALEYLVRSRLDWRRPIRERPLVALGAALAAGFILGVV